MRASWEVQRPLISASHELGNARTNRPQSCKSTYNAAAAAGQLMSTPGAQVARKFLPMVCCKGLLAIMDQHAADERVCLERLRAEVRRPPVPS